MIFLKKQTQQSFEKLYSQHHQKVRGVIFRMLMEKASKELLDELEQEVFIKVWSSLSRFQFQSKIETWLYRISVNTTIDYLRKQKIQSTQYSDGDMKHIEQKTKDINVKFDVQKILTELDEKHRSVLTLYYFEEKSIKEIAAILEIKAGTVKSRLNNAKKKASEIYER